MSTTRPVCDFGRPAVDFALPGVDGRIWRLADVRGPSGTVIVFLCNHCPHVKAVLGRLVDALATLRRAGVGAAAIMPNDTAAYPEDGFENMKRIAAEQRFGFPYLWDESQAVARAYGATVTPEFFGYNRAMRLQYHGRFAAGPGQAGPPGHPGDLAAAMARIAATGEGPPEQVATVGSAIRWRAG